MSDAIRLYVRDHRLLTPPRPVGKFSGTQWDVSMLIDGSPSLTMRLFATRYTDSPNNRAPKVFAITEAIPGFSIARRAAI